MAGLGTILAGLLSGVGEETSRRRKASEEQQAKIEQLIAEQRLKQQFDPELQAKQRAMALVAQLAQPAPELRLRADAPIAGANRLKAEFAQRQQGRTQAQSELDLLQQTGLLPNRLQSTMQVLGINPGTGAVSPLAEVPRGSRTVLMGDQPVYTVDPMTGQQVQTGTVPRNARLVTSPQVPLEKTTSVISAQSSLRTIEELRQAVTNPVALLTRGIPGVKGARDIERLMNNLELEIVTARGGKQLTPSERQLIRQVFPSSLDALDALLRSDPSVIEDKLQELEQKAQDLIQRVPGKAEAASPATPNEDDPLGLF